MVNNLDQKSFLSIPPISCVAPVSSHPLLWNYCVTKLLTQHLHQVIIIVSFIKLTIFLLAAPLLILLLVTDTSPPPDTTMEANTLPDVFIPFFFPFKIIHSFLFFF